MPTETNDDKLFRSIKSKERCPYYWDGDKISYNCFLERGLSVERDCGRSLKEVKKHMQEFSHLCCDYIFSIRVLDCKSKKIFIHHEPKVIINKKTKINEYHYALYRNKLRFKLSLMQARYLWKMAKCEYHKDKYPPYNIVTTY